MPCAVEVLSWVDPAREITLPLSVYNFAATSVKGRLAVEHLPDGWTLTPGSWDLALEPMDRVQFTAAVRRPAGKGGDRKADTWIMLRGEFGSAGRPKSAFCLIAFPGEGYER